MTQSEKLRLSLIAHLAAAYPAAKLTTENVRAYCDWLKEIPDADLESAVRKAAGESPGFFPPAPLVVKCWKDQVRALDNLQAEREWDVILRHIHDFGAVCYPSDRKLSISARAEYALRQSCGADWRQAIGAANDERLHWLRANFLENYNRHAETDGLLAPSRDEARALLDRAMKARKQLGGDHAKEIGTGNTNAEA